MDMQKIKESTHSAFYAMIMKITSLTAMEDSLDDISWWFVPRVALKSQKKKANHIVPNNSIIAIAHHHFIEFVVAHPRVLTLPDPATILGDIQFKHLLPFHTVSICSYGLL